MPNDAELRAMFQQVVAPVADLDAATIIRRSKRRRLPRQVGAGSVLTLAAAGIGVAGVTGVGGLNIMGARTASDIAETAAEAPGWVGADSTAGDAGPYSLDGAEESCELSVAPPAANIWPLRLDVTLHSDIDGDIDHDQTEPLTATVTIRNDGTETLTVTALAPTMHTLQRDGIVVASGSGELLGEGGQSRAEHLELSPGESVTTLARFTMSSCLSGPETLPTGDYLLGTQLHVESADGVLAVITAEPSHATVR